MLEDACSGDVVDRYWGAGEQKTGLRTAENSKITEAQRSFQNQKVYISLQKSRLLPQRTRPVFSWAFAVAKVSRKRVSFC